MEEISSIPAASSPPVPVQPPAKPKTFLLVALGLVLMLGLLFTGVILGQKGFLSGILPVQKSSSTMVPQPTPTPDPTISWTDYVNSEKGYRLKYPSAIFVRVNCPKEELLLRKRNEGETINEENPPNCNRDSRYSVEIVTNDISFTGGIPKGNQYYQVTQEEVSVDQVKATKYTITLISKPNFPYVEWEQQVIFTKGDKKYFLYFANKELENYYSQILSTFKFLDQESELKAQEQVSSSAKILTYALPPGWKTVQDKTGKLEVGYDPNKHTPVVRDSMIELTGSRQDSFYLSLTPYNGGSRHQSLYEYLRVDKAHNPESINWKMPSFHEKEYQYNNWSCLVFYGVGISQYPTTQGMCVVSKSQAVMFGIAGALDPQGEEIAEQTIRTIKVFK